MKAIADHMELPYTDQLLDDITSATDFDTMKKAKFQDEARLRQRLGDAVSVYRKGIPFILYLIANHSCFLFRVPCNIKV